MKSKSVQAYLSSIPERQIQTEIRNFLIASGWLVLRLNTGKYAVGQGVSRRVIMGQEKGTPDLVAFKEGRVVFIEVKRFGKKPSAAQVARMAEIELYGPRCIVAWGIEDVMSL